MNIRRTEYTHFHRDHFPVLRASRWEQPTDNPFRRNGCILLAKDTTNSLPTECIHSHRELWLGPLLVSLPQKGWAFPLVPLRPIKLALPWAPLPALPLFEGIDEVLFLLVQGGNQSKIHISEFYNTRVFLLDNDDLLKPMRMIPVQRQWLRRLGSY